MILVIVALLLGVVVGVVVAYRAFVSATAASSRRALAQLQDTLDGLESAYRIEVATLDARRELAGLSQLPVMESRPQVHLPPVPDVGRRGGPQ